MISFGSRLSDLANHLGKEDQEVAHALGISKSQMSHYTTGKRKVPSELLQKMIEVYGINPEFLFREDAPLYVTNDTTCRQHTYPYYPVYVSAGLPTEVEPLTKKHAESITFPDTMMGKWAGSKNIYFIKVNGDSMNKVIPHHSFIAVKPATLSSLCDGDIVLYSNTHKYSVKRFYNDKKNKRIVFRPDSTNLHFTDSVISYEDANELLIHGKVILYLVEPH